MMDSLHSLPAMSPTRALSSESSFSAGAADTFSNVASLSSTPPTMASDSISLASEDAAKQESHPAHEAVNESIISVAASSVNNTNTDQDGKKAKKPVTDNAHFEATTKSEAVTPSPSPVRPAADSAIELPQPQPIPGTPISTPSSERTRRQRNNAPVYNLAKLSGTAIHGKRRAKGDIVSNKIRRRTDSGGPLFPNLKLRTTTGENATKTTGEEVRDGINALDLASPARSSKPQKANKIAQPAKKETTKKETKKETNKSEDPHPRRIGTRSSGAEAETLTHKISVLGKRGRKTFEKGMSKMSRELRRLQDTNEFSGIDTKPVIYTTWANGKYIDDDEPEPPQKKAKVSESPKKTAAPEPEPTEEEQAPVVKKRRVKQWLDRGLYAGQEAPTDPCKGLTAAEKRKLAQHPELTPSAKVNKALPMPIFSGLHLLLEGRDFKLPYDICNPLPPGQPKPDEWRKMTKSESIETSRTHDFCRESISS